METFVRPGCTHVTVAALVCTAERDRLYSAGARGLAPQLLQHGGWHEGSSKGEAWAADMLVSACGQWKDPGWPAELSEGGGAAAKLIVEP